MSDQPTTADYEPHKIVEEQSELASPLDKEQSQASKEIASADKNKQLSMDVKVYSPFKVYFSGAAFSVSGENVTGPFDILPGHHNFITILSACNMVVRNVTGEQTIQISGGIMHVKADKVIVFLDV